MSWILIAGGCKEAKEQGCLKSCERLNVVDKGNDDIDIHSEMVSPLQDTRRGATLTVLQPFSIAACVGGCAESGNHLKTIEYCNYKSLTNFDWITGPLQGSNAVMGHSCASSTITGQDITIFGGWNGVECLKQVQKFSYDASINQFAHKHLKPLVDGLKNSCALSHADLGEDNSYLFGGWDGKRTLRTVFKYDTITEEQRFTGLLPDPIECHSVAYHSLSKSAFITGGFDGISVKNNIVKCKFDGKTFGFDGVRLEDVHLDIARECHGSVVLNGYLVVFGGWNGFKALDSVEVFHIRQEKPFLKKIKVIGSLVQPRNRPAYALCS